MTQSKDEQKLAYKEKQISLKKSIKEDQKAMKHIASSKTWRMSKPYRRVKQLLFNNQKIEKNELKKVIEELEQALLQAEEQINELTLKDTEQTTSAIQHHIRTIKEKGDLVASLDKIVDDKTSYQANYREALIFAARLYMRAEQKEQQLIYEKVLSGLSIEEIPEFMIRSGLEKDAIPLQNAASFRGSLNMRMRKKQLQDQLPEWPLDDKTIAYQFVDNLNIPTPQVETTHFSLEDIKKQEGIVIKPVDGAGARGVYLVHSIDDIYDVKHSVSLTSWEALISQMQNDLKTEAVSEDAWLIEQLIYEDKTNKIPARDMKFYSFYGKVSLILEIKRDPEIRQCWWLPTGKRVDTGKYEESLFLGHGVTKEEIEMVEALSKNIPAPFLRIDFLAGEDKLVFGEFTPKPGNYEEFNQPIDQLLGDYFLDAEARLVNDLLQGKQFEVYHEIFKNNVTENDGGK